MAGDLSARSAVVLRRFARPLLIFGIACLVFVGGRIVSDALPSWRAAQSLLTLSLFVAVLALGQGLVMLTGGLDLSVPGVIALSATMTALTTDEYGWNMGVAIVLALLSAAGVGLFNGLIVVKFDVPAFIVTLAVNGILVGLTVGWTFGRESPPAPESLFTTFSGSGKLGGVSLPVFFLIAAVIFGYVLQMKSRVGRETYLVGSSPTAARIAGRPVDWILVGVYGICGLGAGVAGVMLLGFSANAQLDLGTEWLIPSISAVLVGGTIIGSGRGDWLSTVAAALLLTTITVVIGATGFSQGWKSVLYGAVVIVALLSTRLSMSAFRRRRSQPARTP